MAKYVYRPIEYEPEIVYTEEEKEIHRLREELSFAKQRLKEEIHNNTNHALAKDETKALTIELANARRKIWELEDELEARPLRLEKDVEAIINKKDYQIKELMNCLVEARKSLNQIQEILNKYQYD